MRDSDPIFLQFGEPAGTTHTYGVAGRLIVSNRAVDELEPFRAAAMAAPLAAPRSDMRPPPTAPVLYADRGWVGGHFALVECRRSDEGFWLGVEGAGEFLVTAQGERIVELRGPRLRKNIGPVDAILGPCLCLALALGRVFCLHASGATGGIAGRASGGETAIVFAGQSGVGKSTLAAALDGRRRSTGKTWRRLCDDILPVAHRDGDPVVLPRFPQLKLFAKRQWGRDRDDAIRLGALFRLTPTAGGEPIRVQRLGGREAAVAVIRHTVAGRLFDAGLASAHLDFAGRLADQVPVYDLSVPRGLETVPEVLAALESVI